MPLARWFTVAWFMATLIGLALPATSLPETSALGTDKLAHLGLFCVGTVGALLGWPGREALVIVALLAFAPLTELWQAVLPTLREPSLFDLIANVLGVLAGWVAVRFFRPQPLSA